MPIQIATELILLNQQDFHALNSRVLRVVFDVHNEFGRFLDEGLYKTEVAARWTEAGFGTVQREVQIDVRHETFRKSYFLDVVFNGGLMLEAKVAEALTASHRTQGLNYMFLAGTQHSLLVNLRPERVEHEYLSTTLTQAERREFTLVDLGWRAVNEESKLFRERLAALLMDWGAFLEVGLYREAIAHFFGGVERVMGVIPVHSGDRCIGNQRAYLLNPETAFAITSSPRNRAGIEEHQRRFLKHTPLRFIQWVNLNRHNIEFTTLAK